MRWLALLVIAGCGRVGFDSRADADHDATVPCFVDRFDVPDTGFWRFETVPSTVQIVVAGGTLQLTPTPMTNDYDGIVSVSRIPFTDTAFEVEVVQTTNPPMSETAIEIEYTAQTRFVLTDDSGTLRFIETNTANSGSRVFDPVADRFWRVAHEQAAAQIRFQTSRDGIQWGGDFVIPTQISGDVLVYLYVGQYNSGNPTPGTAVFDNFRIVRAGCS